MRLGIQLYIYKINQKYFTQIFYFKNIVGVDYIICLLLLLFLSNHVYPFSHFLLGQPLASCLAGCTRIRGSYMNRVGFLMLLIADWMRLSRCFRACSNLMQGCLLKKTGSIIWGLMNSVWMISGHLLMGREI